MKLKLDENLGRRGRALLEADGHDVASVHDERLDGTPDRALAQACAREGRALVTCDLDFANPLLFPPESHAGIAVLRAPRRPTLADFERLLATLVQSLRTRNLQGQLWIVEPGRIREYDKHGNGAQ